MVDFAIPEEHQAIRSAVRELCNDYPDAYWRDLERTKGYPSAFVRAMTEAGWLAVLPMTRQVCNVRFADHKAARFEAGEHLGRHHGAV